jgi:hypothetical protein
MVAIVIALALATVVYKISPALAGAPVFSDDAWPLLADSVYLSVHGSAQFFPATATMPSTYFASWPGLVILTSIVSMVTSAGIIWTPPLVTVAASLLFILVPIALARRFSRKAVWLAALLLLAAAPLDIFYSGYKQEMLAMPMLALLLYEVAKLVGSNKPGLGPKELLICSVLGVAIIASHHFTTFIMFTCLAVLGVYWAIRPGNASGRRGVLPLLAALTGVAVAFYGASGFVLLEGAEPLVLLLIAFSIILVLAGRGALAFRLSFPRVLLYSSIIVLVSLGLVPLVGNFLSVTITLSSWTELLLAFCMMPLIGLGLEVAKRLDIDSYVVFLVWLIAPLSLLALSLFEGNAVLAYRGYIAVLVPGVVLASLAPIGLGMASSSTKEETAKKPVSDRDGNGKGRRLLLATTIGALIAVSIVSGVYSEVAPYGSGRDVISGATWFFPLGGVGAVSEVLSFVPNSTVIYTDVPTVSLVTFLNPDALAVTAIPRAFPSEAGSGVLLLNSMDTNEFFFYNTLENQPVNFSALSETDQVYMGDGYTLFAQ